jgi:hypothetical protein
VGVTSCGNINRSARVIAAKRYEVAGLGLIVVSATRSNAIRSKGGNALARFSARRKIPAQAFALKKYRRGSLPPSKMSDNEDATAALGHSEELSVQNPVSEPVPEFNQRPEQGSKRPSVVDRQDAGDVFPHDPAGVQALSQSEKFQREVATRVIQSEALAGDREGLAGGTSDEKVNGICSDAPEPVAPDRREVAKITNLRKTMGEHGPRERVDFRVPGRAPAQRLPRYSGGFDSRTDGAVDHTPHIPTHSSSQEGSSNS